MALIYCLRFQQDAFVNQSINTTCEICLLIARNILYYLQNTVIQHDEPSKLLVTRCLAQLQWCIRSIKEKYGDVSDVDPIDILNVSCLVDNGDLYKFQLSEPWSAETFFALGPVTIIKILNVVINDMIDSIKVKLQHQSQDLVIISNCNPILQRVISDMLQLAEGKQDHWTSLINADSVLSQVKIGRAHV